MPATMSESIAALPPLQRRMAEAWLTRFEEKWHDLKLRECMRSLPNQSSMRRPLLLAMIERDLAHNWEDGRPVNIENYVQEYPELGGIDEIPIELIVSEYNVRQKHNGAELSEFAERFPTRVDDLYVMLKPGLFDVNAAAGGTSVEDSQSARRLKLLRAPADAETTDPISERRLKLLRMTAVEDALPLAPVLEPVPADPPAPEPAEMFLPPEPPRNEPTRKLEVSPAETVWLDIQTVRPSKQGAQLPLSRSELSTPPMPPPVLGRYTVDKRLGSSGYGSIYLATDTQLDRRVALKIPNFAGPDADLMRTRFHREARAAAGLSHPLLCPVLDVGQINGGDFLVMPFVEGDTLQEVLKQRTIWPARQAVDLVLKLATAMDAAHRQGVVHRDIKPSNVLITPSETPVIVGFGQSALPNHSKRTGNAVYVAPEQAGGAGDPTSPRSDIYSLGVVLYQLLSGKQPQPGPQGDVLQSYPPDLDARLQSICRKATASNPDERYNSMREFASELTTFRQSVRSSDNDLRLPLGGSAVRRMPGSAPGLGVPSGLSAVPGLMTASGLSAVPGANSAASAPPNLAPVGGNSAAFNQMQQLRSLSSQGMPAVAPPRRAPRKRIEGWKWILAGAVGGLALVGTIFALTGGSKKPGFDTTLTQPVEPVAPKPPTIKELAAELAAPSLESRVSTIEKLKARNEPDAVDALVRFVADEAWLETEDRTKALTAIRAMAAEKMVTALKRANMSRDARVRIWACGEIAALIDSDFRDQLMPVLLSAVKDANPEMRQAAAEQISKHRLNDEDIVKALVARVSDDVWGVPYDPSISNVYVRSPDKDGGKNAAAAALYEIAPKRLGPALQQALRGMNPDVKRWAEETKKKYRLE